MNKEEIEIVLNKLAISNPQAIVLDGLNDAIVGVTNRSKSTLIYSEKKCISVIMKDNDCDSETASEFLWYNRLTAPIAADFIPSFVRDFKEHIY